MVQRCIKSFPKHSAIPVLQLRFHDRKGRAKPHPPCILGIRVHKLKGLEATTYLKLSRSGSGQCWVGDLLETIYMAAWVPW